MFGNQYGSLGGFGRNIMDQIGRKEQGNIGEFLGEVQDMAEDRFEIDFGGQSGMGGPIFAYGQKTQNTPNMQMFKEGGAAFPDLSGDGKVTQKDILMGRGVLPMQEGGTPMYADQGSQFMPAAGRPPVPASVQIANQLDQIGRMQEQRRMSIVEDIAKERGVPVQEVLRLLALANSAEATQANPRMSQAEIERMENLMPSVNNLDSPENLMRRSRALQALRERIRMSQAEIERMGQLMPQEMTPINIPYPKDPNMPVDEETFNTLTTGQKMKLLNDLEMGNVQRPVVRTDLEMQEGGNVGIAALEQMGAGQPSPPMPSPPMPAAPMAGIDPAVVEQTLAQMEGNVPKIDDAQDYEQMMNTIRGDQQPIEARYDELADVVGEEDANQTPESVLALVQPVMVMASVDQGIGELAQGEMAQPVQGEMAGGIMTMAGQPQGV